ncbi:hypothetical protein F443_13475 [Phytophthora nicotianae P1569]|uniref:BZIP domain-containing protein n=2 Tax=Phytophthora nicotianae TaxID=4792 RepID=V9EQV8_PHYNI|nr:hypothetical protein F443_13475 [Phytophthora nicotianae P1569]
MQITLQPPGVQTSSDRVIGDEARSFYSTLYRIVEDTSQHQTQQYVPFCPYAKADMEHKTQNGRYSDFKQPDACIQYGRDGRYHQSSQGQTKKTEKKQHFTTTLTNRDYSRQYRERKRKYQEQLENSNRQLSAQITQLKHYRDRYILWPPRTLTVWVVVAEYFRIFRCGIIDSDLINPKDLSFLYATMAPDVLSNTSSGVEALVNDLCLFTQWFRGIKIQLKQLKVITGRSLIAFSTTSFTISAVTMQTVFPHLFSARDGSRSAQIAAQLREKHFVFQSSVRFTWDLEGMQIISLQSQMDMVPALMQKLDTLEDISIMFSNARITPDGNIRTC